VNDYQSFAPARRSGLIFQVSLGVLLLAGSGFSFWKAMQVEAGARQAGAMFILYLLVFVLLFAPLPVLIYRTYSLLGARYLLERDGLRLRWGLRSEDVPLTEIEWVRPASDLEALWASGSHAGGLFGFGAGIPMPRLHWPGALIGVRSVEGLGPIEYIASDPSCLVLVATPQKVFAISPVEPQAFIRAFNRITELGSLTPLSPHSVYPSFFLGRVWADRAARALLGGGFLAGLVLVVWVVLTISTHRAVSLGFNPSGSPAEAGPPERMLLLPVLYGLSYLVAMGAGLYAYRRAALQPVAYLLWTGSVLEGLLLLAAVGWMTAAGGR
jgi:hypothetical protein